MVDRDAEAPLLKVAQAVGDGKPVDWEAEHQRHHDTPGELASLKDLEAVVAGHRAVLDKAPSPRLAGSPSWTWRGALLVLGVLALWLLYRLLA
jgi:hypothetical protein